MRIRPVLIGELVDLLIDLVGAQIARRARQPRLPQQTKERFSGLLCKANQ